MASQPCKQRARSLAGEVVGGHGLGRLKRGQPKARHQKRVTRNANERAKTVLRKLVPMVDDRLHQATPGLTVCAQLLLRICKIALEQYRRTVVERVRQRRLPVNPFQAVVFQRKRGEERRSRPMGVRRSRSRVGSREG